MHFYTASEGVILGYLGTRLKEKALSQVLAMQQYGFDTDETEAFRRRQWAAHQPDIVMLHVTLVWLVGLRLWV